MAEEAAQGAVRGGDGAGHRPVGPGPGLTANARNWAEARPAAARPRRYRERGLWRDTTPAADLRHWARATPDAVAITAHVAGTGVVRMTYREYADQVGRMAAVLAGLGVGRGDVVAV